MKVSQKIISLILVLTMAMGLATTPSFAAAENTEYENSLKSGWGTSTSNFQYPSAYNTSWNRQVINFIDLVAQRTQNIYTTLGTTNSTLSDIKTRTGYIPTISDFLNGLKSNWGDSSSYFTVPSGYRGSWYGASLMLLDTIQQRLAEPLAFEFDTSTQAIIENISSNSGITADSTSSIDNNIVSLVSQYINTQQISTPIQERSTVTGTLSATSKTTPLLVRFLSRSGNSPYKSLESVNGTLTLYDYFHILNNNLIGVNTALVTTGTSYNYRYYNDDMTTGTRTVASLMDMLMLFTGDMSKYISRISYIIADPDTVAAKQANKPQEQNVLSNFTGSGSASASTSDFTGVKDSVSALKTSLSGGASYTQAFNILSGDSDGWSWFSTEVAESMDSTSNGNTRLRGVSDSTPYLDSYYSELSSYLGYSYNGGIE